MMEKKMETIGITGYSIYWGYIRKLQGLGFRGLGIGIMETTIVYWGYSLTSLDPSRKGGPLMYPNIRPLL